MRRLIGLLVFLAGVYACPVLAQTVVGPNSRLVWEQDPGRQQQGTTSAPRPIANVVYELRVDGGAPQAVTLDGPCQPTAAQAGVFTCRALLPAMAEGTHTLELRALASPAEAGVTPGAYSVPLSVAVIVVTAPAPPTNLRLEPPL